MVQEMELYEVDQVKTTYHRVTRQASWEILVECVPAAGGGWSDREKGAGEGLGETRICSALRLPDLRPPYQEEL
jgi:hypothetical protein